MADAEFKKYNKRKYVEIIEAKNKKESRHAIGYLEIWIFQKLALLNLDFTSLVS